MLKAHFSPDSQCKQTAKITFSYPEIVKIHSLPGTLNIKYFYSCPADIFYTPHVFCDSLKTLYFAKLADSTLKQKDFIRHYPTADPL